MNQHRNLPFPEAASQMKKPRLEDMPDQLRAKLKCIRLTNYTADHGAGLLGLLSVRPSGGREFSDLVNWKVAQSWQD
jgi:hypothetical protein